MGADSLQPTSDLDSGVRVLLEQLAERLQMTKGRWRCEFTLHDGRVHELYRHEGAIPARALDRFDTPSG